MNSVDHRSGKAETKGPGDPWTHGLVGEGRSTVAAEVSKTSPGIMPVCSLQQLIINERG